MDSSCPSFGRALPSRRISDRGLTSELLTLRRPPNPSHTSLTVTATATSTSLHVGESAVSDIRDSEDGEQGDITVKRDIRSRRVLGSALLRKPASILILEEKDRNNQGLLDRKAQKGSSRWVKRNDARPGANMERAERLQNGMARHRTPALTRPRVSSTAVEVTLQALKKLKFGKGFVAELMDKHKEMLEPRDVRGLVNELQRRHDWRSVMEVFGWMKKQEWHVPSARFYTMLIGFMARESQPSLATLLFQEMLLERQEPDSYTFTALINAYGRARMFDDALAVFIHMKECESLSSRPNTVTCNVLIATLCRGGLYDHAVEIFLDMRATRNGLGLDCKPNIVTYNTLLDALCREGQLEAAISVLSDLADGRLDDNTTPNTATYNTLVDACGKAGNAVKAEMLVTDMEARGLQPDGITFTALIDAYGKEGMLDKAEGVFRSMRTRGASVDVLTFTALMAAYGRFGFLERTESLLEEMKQMRLEPNEVTYLSMIDACGKAGKGERAQELFQEMVVSGQRPNVYTYSALMDAFGRCGEYHKAARCFERMKEDGCRPNLITYAALLHACGRCKDWEAALQLLYCLQKSGSQWELAMCRLVLGGPEEKDLWENAMLMFEGMQIYSQGMRRSFYNALIDTLWSFGLRGRAGRVLSEGRRLGVYGEDMFTYKKQERSAVDEWRMDLHDSSLGAAAALLFHWLGELRMAWQWGEGVPERILVVTGWGKHCRTGAGSPLKASIAAELEAVGAPFQEETMNAGRLCASGNAVYSWLTSEGTESRLTLTDTLNPRPEGEPPFED